MVYFDGIVVNVRGANGRVSQHTIYVAIGVDLVLPAGPDVALTIDDGEANYGGVAAPPDEGHDARRRGELFRLGLARQKAHPGGHVLARGRLRLRGHVARGRSGSKLRHASLERAARVSIACDVIERDGPGEFWLLDPSGVRDAELVGARVAASEPGSDTLLGTRVVFSNQGYRTSSALEAHFGLGRRDKVDVTVTLLNGMSSVFKSVAADQYVDCNLAKHRIQAVRTR